MTPAARVQAAIEVLDAVIAAARGQGAPADRILSDWFRARRFAGGADRRAVRDLVYAAIRHCGEVPSSGRAAMLGLAADDAALACLFDGSRHGPAPIGQDEPKAAAGIAPAWLMTALAASGVTGAGAAALLGRAPLDVRVNALKAARATLALPLAGEPTAAPHGLRYPPGTPVEQWEAYRAGLIEVQDTGSQLASAMLAARAGETVIDLCAGAGGKTLAIAADMACRGTLVACDTDRGRLAKLAPRAARAGARLAETLLLNPGRELDSLARWRGRADAVLIDAPCSGSGTWRRNPEARWRIDPPGIARLVALQRRLLDIAVELARSGTRLLYVVCSLLDVEGAGQVADFLARYPKWRVIPPVSPLGSFRGGGIRLDPEHDGTDGFFIACLVHM